MKNIFKKSIILFMSICLMAHPAFASNVKVSPKTGQKAIGKAATKTVENDDGI